MTAIYPFYLPVALVLFLCGSPVEYKSESDPEYYELALDILLPLGGYFQIRTTTLIFPRSLRPELLGKIGKDITDKPECSWCINTAPKYANLPQRAVLDANYDHKMRSQRRRLRMFSANFRLNDVR